MVTLRSRPFNTVLLEPGSGLVWKSSRDAEKIAAEASWLASAASTGGLAPALVASGTMGQQGWHCTEFVSGPTLADLLLREPTGWGTALECLDDFVSRLHVPIDVPRESRAAAAEAMYVSRPLERLRLMPDDLRHRYWRPLRSGSSFAPGLHDLERMLESRRDALIPPLSSFARVHGDLCAGNLIVRLPSGPGPWSLRAVDPRGSFGALGIAGDPVYDLAKLSQSFLGGYDFACAGRFSISRSAGDSHLTLRGSIPAAASFQEWLTVRAARLGRTVSQVRLVEALLFVSMVPLHYEDPRRQEALLLAGLRLLGQLL